jgi:NTE family protein
MSVRPAAPKEARTAARSAEVALCVRPAAPKEARTAARSAEVSLSVVAIRLGLMATTTLVAIIGACLMSGCSSARPWINQPIKATSPRPQAATVHVDADTAPPSIIAAVTLSGGGARAAAFGFGVLEEMKATRFQWEGRETTLLDEVGLVSGVSGGSILAAYWATFGDEVFTRFEPEFLHSDFQQNLVTSILLSPVTHYHMTSPWVGRSNVLADRLDTLYRGATFGDQRKRAGHRPELLVTATDLTTGAAFEFTPEQFALICSDLDSVPLSFAVASSSAVPVVFSPMTVRNYAGSCPESQELAQLSLGDRNAQARLLNAQAQSYLDVQARPYLHLVDGGLADNLGVRGLMDRTTAGGGFQKSFGDLPTGSVHKVILVSVDSERALAERIDLSDRVPSVFKVVDSLIFGAGSHASHETLELMNDSARRWADELLAGRGQPGSPFAADAEIFVIHVSLFDYPDPALRDLLLQVPTALSIPPLEEKMLREAGRKALSSSPQFQRLLSSLPT